MPVDAGTRLGPYEIVSPLGAGGMGEVYRARDTRLGREVAIKVLPAHLSANPEVRARFEREAKSVSSLSHPHICALYDVGREGTTDYIVMELLEGETLAQRLSRGPLPFDAVLRHGIEIADALDRAHRQGLIHRDLKPGNVMLTRSGAKLLDFGLARATGMNRAGGDLTTSPTVAAPLTAEGTIVGTYQYMAPEQLEGREADQRSDLWAFGAMLYEMATGRRAFEGRSQASLIAAILERDPAPMATAPSTPGAPAAPLAALEPLVRACLAKDPEERVQTAHDVKLQLRWMAGASATTSVASGSVAAVPVPVVKAKNTTLPWIVAGVAALAAVALALPRVLQRETPPSITRFTISPAPGLRTMTWPRLSPDGRILAFQGTDTSGVTRVWVRPLDELTPRPLVGTEGAGRPFWSPDSRYLGYFENGRLMKVAVSGEPPQMVTETAVGADGAWSTTGIILFDGTAGDSIHQISAAGGTVTAASFVDRSAGEFGHTWPFVLPDGKHFLHLAEIPGKPAHLKVSTLGSKESRDLGTITSRAEYSPTGHILWVSSGVLLARAFDARALRFTGEAFPVASGVATAADRALISVSSTGDLAYSNTGAQEDNQLVWFERSGKMLGPAGPPGAYGDLALSPDQKRVAYDVLDNGGIRRIWVRDLGRDVATQITFGAHDAIWPTWSPDGQWIAFASNQLSAYGVYMRSSSGAGTDSLLNAVNSNEGPSDWSGVNGRIVMTRFVGMGGDLFAIEPRGGAPVQTLVSSPASEAGGVISPDGRWLAYISNESGANEVYVQTMPPSGGKWQISSKGGIQPFWRGDGRELFYYSRTREIKSVAFTPGPSPEIGAPVTLFEQVLAINNVVRNRFVVTADGQRFLLNIPPPSRDIAGFTVVQNWASGARKK